MNSRTRHHARLEPVPGHPPVISCYVDDRRIGFGTRVFIVIRKGRKWVKLLSLGCLKTIRISRAAFDRATPIVTTPEKARDVLARLMDRHRDRVTKDIETVYQSLKGEHHETH